MSEARADRRGGFTLLELLSAVALLAIAMVGISRIYAQHNHAFVGEDSRAELEQNLRLGLSMVTDTLRNSNYGVPANVTNWITWVPGFTSNPMVVDNTGSPDAISIASATAQPVATLAAAATSGATTLTLSTTSGVNMGNQDLILIGDSENALVTAIAGSQITIDTDPTTVGNQGLARAYPQGTAVYRVDVITFTIATSGGVSELLRNDNHGGTAQAAIEGITDMQITTVTAGKLYQLALTGQTRNPDPVTAQYVTRTLQTNVALVN